MNPDRTTHSPSRKPQSAIRKFESSSKKYPKRDIPRPDLQQILDWRAEAKLTECSHYSSSLIVQQNPVLPNMVRRRSLTRRKKHQTVTFNKQFLIVSIEPGSFFVYFEDQSERVEIARFYKSGQDEIEIDQISVSQDLKATYLVIITKTNHILLFQLGIEDKRLVVTKLQMRIRLNFFPHSFIWRNSRFFFALQDQVQVIELIETDAGFTKDTIKYNEFIRLEALIDYIDISKVDELIFIAFTSKVVIYNFMKTMLSVIELGINDPLISVNAFRRSIERSPYEDPFAKDWRDIVFCLTELNTLCAFDLARKSNSNNFTELADVSLQSLFSLPINFMSSEIFISPSSQYIAIVSLELGVVLVVEVDEFHQDKNTESEEKKPYYSSKSGNAFPYFLKRHRALKLPDEIFGVTINFTDDDMVVNVISDSGFLTKYRIEIESFIREEASENEEKSLEEVSGGSEGQTPIYKLSQAEQKVNGDEKTDSLEPRVFSLDQLERELASSAPLRIKDSDSPQSNVQKNLESLLFAAAQENVEAENIEKSNEIFRLFENTSKPNSMPEEISFANFKKNPNKVVSADPIINKMEEVKEYENSVQVKETIRRSGTEELPLSSKGHENLGRPNSEAPSLSNFIGGQGAGQQITAELPKAFDKLEGGADGPKHPLYETSIAVLANMTSTHRVETASEFSDRVPSGELPSINLPTEAAPSSPDPPEAGAPEFSFSKVKNEAPATKKLSLASLSKGGFTLLSKPGADQERTSSNTKAVNRDIPSHDLLKMIKDRASGTGPAKNETENIKSEDPEHSKRNGAKKKAEIGQEEQLKASIKGKQVTDFMSGILEKFHEHVFKKLSKHSEENRRLTAAAFSAATVSAFKEQEAKISDDFGKRAQETFMPQAVRQLETIFTRSIAAFDATFKANSERILAEQATQTRFEESIRKDLTRSNELEVALVDCQPKLASLKSTITTQAARTESDNPLLSKDLGMALEQLIARQDKILAELGAEPASIPMFLSIDDEKTAAHLKKTQTVQKRSADATSSPLSEPLFSNGPFAGKVIESSIPSNEEPNFKDSFIESNKAHTKSPENNSPADIEHSKPQKVFNKWRG